ncbi:MAG TPA: hypothetical protein VFW64_15865, partial [Pseudonocardiaceae bacterium]|nr:hypothetical protein [Pseudonocardiaceae bacterium]
MSTPADSVAAITGQPVRTAAPLGAIWRLDLGDGRTVVAKRAQPGQALAEAAGLRWLRVPDG